MASGLNQVRLPFGLGSPFQSVTTCVEPRWSLRPRGVLTAALLWVGLGAAYRGPVRPDPGQLLEQESLYGYFQVTRDAAGWTRLRSSESVSSQSVWPADGILTGGVWDQLALTPALARRSAPELRVLIVGLAAGTVARQVHDAYSSTTRVLIHGIELDRAVVEAGRRHFGLGTVPDLTVDTRDARVAVESLRGSFDAIVVDVFRGLYVPPHLATREFFAACRRRLAPGGVLAMNLALPLDGGRLLGTFASTLEAVFTNVRFMRLPSSGPVANTILFASDAGLAAPGPEQVPEPLRAVGIQLLPVEIPPGSRRILSDDHAPIEWLTDRALLEALDPPSVP